MEQRSETDEQTHTVSQMYRFAHLYMTKHNCPEDDLDDLVQDTVWRIYASQDRFRGDSSWETWMFRICSNRLAEYYRQKYRNRKGSAALAVYSQSATYEPCDPIDSIYAVQILDLLEDTHRSVVTERIFNGKSFVEIAIAHGASYEATRSTYRRAIKKLRRELGNTQ